MFRQVTTFFAVFMALLAPTAQENIEASLSRAHALYDEGKFEESLQLVLLLDDALRTQDDRIQLQIEVKLQLALLHIALDQTSDARKRLTELYAIEPYYALDPQEYPSKLVSMFNEVRTEARSTCSKICREGDALLENADAAKLLELIAAQGERCACLEALAKDAAEFFFQRGNEAQQIGDLSGALAEFELAGKLDPNHAHVRSAIAGVHAQAAAFAEKALQQWRADMAAGQFGLASAIYRQMMATKTDNAAKILEQMQAGYRQHLAPAVQQWNEGCSRNDALMMNRARARAEEVLPDPQSGRELITEWMVCAR